MILGLASMLVGNAACLLGAFALWKRCRTGHSAADAALFLLIRFTLASAAVLASGLAGCLNAPALGLGGLAVLGVLLLAGEHRGLARLTPGTLRARVPLVLLLLAAGFLLRLVVQAWFLAPHAGDVASYHLPKVAEWIQAGRITAETGIAYRSPFPGGFELFEIWWCVFLHHDVLIEMAGVELWCMAFAAVCAIARRAGLPVQDSFLASLAFCASPVIVMQAVTCLNDLPVVAVFLTATALILVRALPLLLALPVAVGLGVKPTFGFALPGLLLLAVLVRRDGASTMPKRGVVVGLATVAFGLGAYWYLRNWLLYGNPIHPATRGGVFEEQMVQQVGPSLWSLKENLRRVIDSRIYDSLRGYNPQCDLAANWGPAAFALGLPGLLVALREEAVFRRLGLAYLLSMGCVLLMVQSDAWFTRFILFVPAILSLAGARLAAGNRGVSLILAGCLGYQFVATLVTDRLAPVGEYRSMYAQGWRERRSTYVDVDLLRGETRVATCGYGDYDYLLYGPDFARRVIPIRASEPERIVEEMRRGGTRFIRGSGPAVSALQGAVKKGLLKPSGGSFFRIPE